MSDKKHNIKLSNNETNNIKFEPVFDRPIHVGRPNIGDKELFLDYASQILKNKWLTNDGPFVKKLEYQIAKHIGVKHCVAMCNGTLALEIAIRALDLKDEVIVPSFTFIATAHALYWQGIKPVFADINPQTHILDPNSVVKKITKKTTGIIGVHLWGQPSNIDKLQEISDQYKLRLIFDAAHAFSCNCKGKIIGNFGDCEVFSFHATKFFNTFEGGAIVTNNSELAEKIKLMRNFGFSDMDKVIYPGTNAKMSEISAAMGLVNIKFIDKFIEHNKNNYLAYKNKLHDIPGITLFRYNKSDQNNYQYIVIEVAPSSKLTRDEIIQKLHKQNIFARRYFWPGCHNMSPYKDIYNYSSSSLKFTEEVADRVIVLPTGESIDEEKIDIISTILSEILD